MEEKTIVVKRGGFGPFLRGALIGAGIALLFAPHSGKETRMMLSEKGSEMRNKAKDMARESRDRAETALNDARNKLDERIQGVKEGFQSQETKTEKQLKRELEISEEINNPIYPL